jgi:uncharacterized membrane protein
MDFSRYFIRKMRSKLGKVLGVLAAIATAILLFIDIPVCVNLSVLLRAAVLTTIEIIFTYDGQNSRLLTV